jgi:hypothetical protein
MIIISDDPKEVLARVISNFVGSESRVVVLSPSLRHSNQLLKDVISICEPDRNIIGFEANLGFTKYNNVWFMPIGDGTKARGLRANHLVCNNYTMLSKEVLDTVIRGFAIVNSNPIKALEEPKKED